MPTFTFINLAAPLIMQAALSLPYSFIPPTKSKSKSMALLPTRSIPFPLHFTSQHPTLFKAQASAIGQDPSTVDYSSTSSVFPAEACETVGGEACDVEMYPEVKLKSDANKNAKSVSEPVDREYLNYDSPKTVFPGEACDELGGEFCDPEYQKGVF